jgi:hypothetical protein
MPQFDIISEADKPQGKWLFLGKKLNNSVGSKKFGMLG